jgi:hypothetical protein
LTEKKDDKQAEDTNLFENKFVIVSQSGEVQLKKTDLFEERTNATIDTESIEEEIRKLESAFSEGEEKVNKFLEEAGELEVSEIKDKMDTLLNDLSETVAVGDFDSLVANAKEKVEQIVQKKEEDASEAAVEKSDEAEPDAEVSEDVDTEPETESDDVKAEIAGESDKAKAKVEPAEESEEKEEPRAEESKETDEEPEADSEPANADEKEEPAETEEIAETEEAEEKEEPTPEEYYKNLAEKAETLSELSDWAQATLEFENIDYQWAEGPDAGDADITPYRVKIDELREALEQKKKEHYEEQKKIREKNLARKKEALNELKEIIEKEQWTKTKAVSRLKGKWGSIRPIPAEEQEKLDQEFENYIATFDEHKVDRLVKQKQQQDDNLTGKLVTLEKMDSFLSGIDASAKDWVDLDKKFSVFSKQFRKIGRVPSEKNQGIWDRYHQAQDTFHSLRFKFDKKYRQDIEKFLSNKKKLIDEAEALLDTTDLAQAARKVNKLHRKWKKAGNLPQKEENELWDRFKAATDAFNEKKSENIELLHKQEDKNYQAKLKLIEKAEEIKDSEDWENTHKQLQGFMEQWKKIGPVPKRKSGKIWKKFKGAMDHFYDRRRDHFKEVKEERKDNLKEKEDVLDKLKELQTHEDPIEAVEEAKKLQEEFKKAGYVPIKHKNRMWKEYREACDVIYDRFRTAKSAARIVGKENVENFSTDDLSEIKKKQGAAIKLRKEIKSLSSDLLQMKESLSYFKPSGSGSSLLDDVKKRIDKAEDEINKKEEKLQEMETEIDKIKRGV